MTEAQPNKPCANIRIILTPTLESRQPRQPRQSWTVPITPETTLEEILSYIKIDPELFNQFNANPYVFVSEGGTLMQSLNSNMIYYNNWDVNHGYVSSLYIKHLSDVSPDEY